MLLHCLGIYGNTFLCRVLRILCCLLHPTRWQMWRLWRWWQSRIVNTASCSLTLSGQNNAIVVLLHSTAWLGSVSTTLYMNRVVQRAEPSKPIARRNQAVASRRDRCLHRCFSRLEAMHATICQPGLRQHLLIASVRPIYESRLIFSWLHQLPC